MNDKDYVSWVRNHIGPRSSRMMREFKIYIAHRDQGKSDRIKGQRLQQMMQRAAGARLKSSGRVNRRGRMEWESEAELLAKETGDCGEPCPAEQLEVDDRQPPHQGPERPQAGGGPPPGCGHGSQVHPSGHHGSGACVMPRKVRKQLLRIINWIESSQQMRVDCFDEAKGADSHGSTSEHDRVDRVDLVHVVYGGHGPEFSLLKSSRLVPMAEKQSVSAAECELELRSDGEHVQSSCQQLKPSLVVCTPCVSMPNKKQLKRQNLRKQAEKCMQHVVDVCKVLCSMAVSLFCKFHGTRCELQSRCESAVGHACFSFSSDMCCFGSQDPKNQQRCLGAQHYITDIAEHRNLAEKCSDNHVHQDSWGNTKIGEHEVRASWCSRVMPEKFAKMLVRACRQSRNQQGVDVLVSEQLSKPRDDKSLLETIKRCHNNLGHPSRERFLHMLRTAGANEKAFESAKKFQCSTCEAKKPPEAHQISKHRRAEGFNQQLCVDVLEVPIFQQKKLKCLSVVCEGTGLHVVVPLWKGAMAEAVRKGYRKGWTRWGGVLIRLFSDNGLEFDAVFQEALDIQGTYSEKTAAEAPWQNGIVERNNQTWKPVFEKAFEESHPTNKQEVNDLIDQVNNAKNAVVKRHGYSPFQHVFGCSLRFPSSIQNEDACVVHNSAFLHGDHDVVRGQALRMAARQAMLAMDNDDKLRRAIEALLL